MDGDEDNSLFYVDDRGLYRYVFGGNVVEQLIDGSLNSLSAVNKAFSAIVGRGGRRFVLLENWITVLVISMERYSVILTLPIFPLFQIQS